jgi:hypothetical protein
VFVTVLASLPLLAAVSSAWFSKIFLLFFYFMSGMIEDSLLKKKWHNYSLRWLFSTWIIHTNIRHLIK